MQTKYLNSSRETLKGYLKTLNKCQLQKLCIMHKDIAQETLEAHGEEALFSLLDEKEMTLVKSLQSQSPAFLAIKFASAKESELVELMMLAHKVYNSL